MLQQMASGIQIEGLYEFLSEKEQMDYFVEERGLPFLLALIEEKMVRGYCTSMQLYDYVLSVAPSLEQSFVSSLLELLKGDNPSQHMFFGSEGDVLILHPRDDSGSLY